MSDDDSRQLLTGADADLDKLPAYLRHLADQIETDSIPVTRLFTTQKVDDVSEPFEVTFSVSYSPREDDDFPPDFHPAPPTADDDPSEHRGDTAHTVVGSGETDEDVVEFVDMSWASEFGE